MKVLLSGILGILCLQQAFCQEEILVPYSLIETSRNGNSLTLSCEGSGSFGTPGAVFFRNGVDRNSDPCLQKAVVDESKGDLMLTLTASCEGSYMCGITQSEGRFILSGPRKVFGEGNIYTHTFYTKHYYCSTTHD